MADDACLVLLSDGRAYVILLSGFVVGVVGGDGDADDAPLGVNRFLARSVKLGGVGVETLGESSFLLLIDAWAADSQGDDLLLM